MKKLIIVLMFVLGLCSLSQAALVKEFVEYEQGNIHLEGYLVYDDSVSGERPGVIVVHDWMGFGEYGNWRAEELAKLGYAALAIDIYGKGVRPKDTSEASQQAMKYKSNRKLMRKRAKAGFEFLRDHPLVDEDRIAAIGYCFGGTVALEMARAGLDLAGVVSFHGGLDTPDPDSTRGIKAKILVLHGALDPFVSPEEIAAFQKELTQADADWQMVYYSGAVHSFTKKASGSDISTGAAYNEEADRRSWAAMKQFFQEIFE